MTIDDSINAKLLSIIAFPRTPYVALLSSNLRCREITKYLFVNDLLGNPFLLSLLRENSTDQIAIQCAKGSSGTGQHPKNDFFHDIGQNMISSRSPVE
jgi:hypothetical protein